MPVSAPPGPMTGNAGCADRPRSWRLNSAAVSQAAATSGSGVMTSAMVMNQPSRISHSPLTRLRVSSISATPRAARTAPITRPALAAPRSAFSRSAR